MENKIIPVYSPSRTETFDQCHLKYELRKWTPRVWAKRDLARFVGIAGAEALAVWNRTPDAIPALIEKTAQEAFARELEPYLKAGVEVERLDLDESIAALCTGLVKFAKDDPLSAKKGWRMQDVELEMTDHGRARIDWGGVDPYGVLCQVDYKIKLNLEARWYDKEVERYRYSPQMMHYCWAYGEYLGKPVSRYYICLIVLAPRFSVRLHQYEIDPELQQAWLTSARQKWNDMAEQVAGNRVPDMASTHRTPYGDCEYTRACLEYRLDPSLMSTHYVEVKRDRNQNQVP